MHYFIKRNQKKLLAVFGVVLMIAFLLPSTFRGAASLSDVTVGMIGQAKVTGADLERANRELRGFAALASDPAAVAATDDSMVRNAVGLAQLFSQPAYRDKPITYVLLYREAEAAGIVPPREQVDQLAYAIRAASRAAMTEDDAAAAAGHLLSVASNLDRSQARLKVTLPLLQRAVAQSQEPTLNIMDFRGDEFASTVPQPSADEVRAAYDQYATVSPRSAAGAPTTQPAKLGYLKPTQVKLQYVQIPKARLTAAAARSLAPTDLYDLDRVAVAYYSANPKEFEKPAEEPAPATRSATNPASNPASNPTSGPASNPTTTVAADTKPAGPVLKTYVEARDELHRRLLGKDLQPQPGTPADLLGRVNAIRERADKKVGELRQAVVDKLQSDYQAHLKGQPVNIPAATQASAASQPTFESTAYLEAVLTSLLGPAPAAAMPAAGEPPKPPAPAVRSLDDKWYTAQTANDVEGINLASAADGSTFAQLVVKTNAPAGPATEPSPATAPTTTASASGPTTVAAATQPTAPAASRPAATSVLALYQPSPLLTSASAGDSYAFRLTAFEGERVPSFDEVREQVTKDLVRNRAYQAAREKAEQIRGVAANRAAGKAEGGLPGASEYADNRKVVIAGPVTAMSPQVEGYPVSDPAAADALQAAIRVVAGRATTREPHPSAIVDMPTLDKVAAVELRSVERGWSKDQDFVKQREIVTQSVMAEQPQVGQMWLSPEVVAKRTGYVPSGKGE